MRDKIEIIINSKLEDAEIEYIKRVHSSDWEFDGRQFVKAGMKTKTVIQLVRRKRDKDEVGLKIEPMNLELLADVQKKCDEEPVFQFLIGTITDLKQLIIQTQHQSIETARAFNAFGQHLEKTLGLMSNRKIITGG